MPPTPDRPTVKIAELTRLVDGSWVCTEHGFAVVDTPCRWGERTIVECVKCGAYVVAGDGPMLSIAAYVPAVDRS